MSTKSPGPVSPAVTLSDRAGEESFENQTASAPNDPLARVLRTLDSIDMPAGPVRTHEVGTVEQAPDGSQTDPAGGDPAPTDPAAPAPGRSDPAAPVRPGRPEGPGLPARRPSADEPAIPASPPEPLRTPAPAAQTRSEAILDGAARLFAERGYHGSSLRDISREVGISHPGMLHHFASKDALLSAVIDRMEDHAQGLLDSIEQIGISEASLDAALGGPWNPKNHLMGLLATLSAEVVNPKHPGRYRIARLRLVHEHVLEEVLQAFDTRGQLADGADPTFVARSTFSLLLSLAVRERSVRALQRVEKAEPVADVHAFVRHYIVG
ncbi:MAG TPA: TetR family transcriptional regulator [Candidatus Brachybacterium merdavium]|uniref:TetR family transcriptional regulator n=1 Tax=Candidatus Brachybacterium merdavium TaxID=2838513 RepID=A0A9D2LDK7_9MICO|nr:TetR family transcriptional regulator [Candidatus Brachybacterium merdavium]